VPQGQTTTGRNIGPVPYNYGQAFTPKTAVGVIEETHVFSPRIVNQFKYGYARYNGPTINPNITPAYASSTLGITGLPAGQAAAGFPVVTFPVGTAAAPTSWGGAQANITIAENYTLVDARAVERRQASLTIGGQVAGSSITSHPLRADPAFDSPPHRAETASFLNGTFAATQTPVSPTPVSSSSQIDKGSLTQNLVQEYGSRYRAISPYIQDN
jgi:hypothetical protein